MPAQPRPIESSPTTVDNLFIGLPIVDFAPVVNGVQQPFIELGILDNAEMVKELDSINLEDASSGTRVTVTELITRIDPEFNIGLFKFSAEILQFTLGSGTVTAVTADAAAAVTNERVSTTVDSEDYLALANRLLNSGSVVVTPAAVVNEQVGVGDGTTGDASGDFTLDYKVRVVADVTRVEVNNGGVVTAYSPVAVGAASSGNEVEVVVGRGSDSGDLQFFVGGVASNVTGVITSDYEPSFALTEGLPGDALNAVDDARSDDGGIFTDETADANSATANDVTLTPAVPAVSDAFYVGMQDGKFNRVRFNIASGQEGVDYTVVWEYSQGGGTWAALPNVTDPSVGFTVPGTALDVTFDAPADWVPDTVDSVEAHYVRARVATIGTPTGAVGTQIWTSARNDYLADLKGGRLQVNHDATKTGSRSLIAEQDVFVDYTYNRLAHNELKPFTQNVFSGVARIRHLADVGINLIWDIPSAQIQLTDDALTFDDENFAVGSLSLKLLDAGGSNRFGTLQVFSRSEAGNAN